MSCVCVYVCVTTNADFLRCLRELRVRENEHVVRTRSKRSDSMRCTSTVHQSLYLSEYTRLYLSEYTRGMTRISRTEGSIQT